MTLLRKHGPWLVAATLAGIAGAWLYLLARPVNYTSTSQVDVEANVAARTTPILPNMATEAQVATSGMVLASTARSLGMMPGRLSTALSAKTVGTADVLSISCTMPTPTVAQRCAAAAAAGYVAFRNGATGSASSRALNPQHVTLVTVASLPREPAGPGLKILLPIGAFLGLLLGVGGVAVRDHLDDRVRDLADLERFLDGPVLAEIPRIRRRVVNPAFAFRDAPVSPAAEAYRYLRARVRPLLGSDSHDGAVLLVAGARAQEGRTSVAINLATAIANAGKAVILVDADLRHPSLSERFQVGERPGMAELLAGRASLEEVAVPTDVPGLRLVSAGRVRPSADTFGVTHLRRAFAGMRATADVVVVDSPPVLTVADAITLASVSDLVAVVADLRRTCRGDVRAAGQQIRAAGPQASVVGVLNRVPRPLMNGSRRGITQEPESLARQPSVPALLASSVPPRGPNGQGEVPLSGAAVGGDHGQPDAATDPYRAPSDEDPTVTAVTASDLRSSTY